MGVCGEGPASIPQYSLYQKLFLVQLVDSNDDSPSDDEEEANGELVKIDAESTKAVLAAAIVWGAPPPPHPRIHFWVSMYLLQISGNNQHGALVSDQLV